MRVYDPRQWCEVYESEGEYRASIVKTAKERGYAGVALGAYRAAKNPLFKGFLFELKKKLLAEGLHLFYEYDGDGCAECCEIADGCVLIYEKCALDEVSERYGFPTAAIVAMSDVTEYLHNRECLGRVVIDDACKAAIDAYYETYGAK